MHWTANHFSVFFFPWVKALMNILFRVISPINIFDIGFLQKCLQLIIFWFELLFIWLHFPTFSTAAAYFFFYELKITKYFANMPDFIMSENNPINNLGRCQQMLWEVYKRVEWFLKRIFGEFLHSNLLKQSFIKTQDNSSVCSQLHELLDLLIFSDFSYLFLCFHLLIRCTFLQFHY